MQMQIAYDFAINLAHTSPTFTIPWPHGAGGLVLGAATNQPCSRHQRACE